MSRLLAFRDLIYSDSPQPQRVNREQGFPEKPLLACSLNCRECKRTLIPGALYADGWEDTTTLCHVHHQGQAERNLDALLKRAGKATGWDWESMEGRYGR